MSELTVIPKTFQFPEIGGEAENQRVWREKTRPGKKSKLILFFTNKRRMQ